MTPCTSARPSRLPSGPAPRASQSWVRAVRTWREGCYGKHHLGLSSGRAPSSRLQALSHGLRPLWAHRISHPLPTQSRKVKVSALESEGQCQLTYDLVQPQCVGLQLRECLGAAGGLGIPSESMISVRPVLGDGDTEQRRIHL